MAHEAVTEPIDNVLAEFWDCPECGEIVPIDVRVCPECEGGG